MTDRFVVYTYRCPGCGLAGEERLRGDTHDGEESACSACGATVVLEWDGGGTLRTSTSLAAEAVERARDGR